MTGGLLMFLFCSYPTFEEEVPASRWESKRASQVCQGFWQTRFSL